jgi:preprotein translocase subunit SecB
MADTPANAQQGQFGIQKIYVKDVSFETPNSPQIFTEAWNPKVNMDVANSAARIGEDLHEVVLSVTVKVNFGEKTVYLAEVQQAGIFHISGFPTEALGRMLATVCANILFPFAREAIADLVMRGGFPQLLLAPVNFEALYLQQQRAQQAEGDKTKH